MEHLIELRSSLSRVFEELRDDSRTTAGVNVSPESALQCGAVLACVRVLAESVASLPFGVYRRISGGGKEIADELPLYEVLAYQPNSWMTSFEFRELMQSWLLLWGNAYAEIKSGRRGAVTELIPLHPSRMVDIKRIENGRLRYYYHDPSKTQPIEYNQDKIFHLRWLSRDGVKGYVPTMLSRDAIALARAAELHSGAFFGNGARPGVVIETDEPHKPETLMRLRQSWEDMHRGPDRYGRTAVLPHGMHAKIIGGDNNRDSALIETRRLANEDVARVYRVPPHMIGDLSNVRHSTVEQSAIDFVTFSLMPHLKRWEMACRRDLVVDDKQYFCEFDTTALMAGDYEARSKFIREMANLGALDVDEIRAYIGKNPLPDGQGKKRFVQVNMQLLEGFTAEAPTGNQPDQSVPPVIQQQQQADESRSSEVVFRTALRRLAAVEASGIRDRRNNPKKLEAWLDACAVRMKNELRDAAEATGRDIDAFVLSWNEASKEALLDCHRSGKPYEEALETWTERQN